MRYIKPASVALGCGTLLFALGAAATPFPTVNADPPSTEAGVKAEPVEKDMHEFMEYYFQPTYLRLKKSMASEPADKQGWKAIKSDALILAQGGNQLLLLEQSSEADWKKASAEVRSHGAELYRAGKARDFKAASRSYRSMLASCNACHKQYEDGKHILKP